MAIARTPFKQNNILIGAGVVMGGICLELSRRWIRAKLSNQWVRADTIYTLSDGGELRDAIAGQRAGGTMADVGTRPLDHVNSNSRTPGGCCGGFQGLRSRADVINHVITIPGAYIFAATGKNSGGHAFAFDTTDVNSIAFLDPNQGEWVFTNESHDNMRTWWDKFWEGSGGADGGIDYKKQFHNGDRELYKYTVSPGLVFVRPHAS